VFITAAAEDLASFATDLTAHLNDTADAHDASAISFTPAGNVAATDVQAAIAELDSEKLSTTTAASTYQPLDADLTAIAALTSAANKVPYSTGAGTWALADFSAAGRNLVDDADASAQRTTLGLGTAAVKDTGTSGNTVPLLDGANTFSARQDITVSTSFATALGVTSTNADALSGPIVDFQRNSASPAPGDNMGAFNFRGNNASGTSVIYSQMVGGIVDTVAGAEYGRISFSVYDNGVNTAALTIRNGVFVGAPTGSAKGTGTLNAVTLYENGTSLASKYQGLDTELTALAGLTSAADQLPYFTGSGTAALATFTTAGRDLIDDADASAQRTTLGLGTAAVKNTSTSGNNVPLLDGNNTWSARQTMSGTGIMVSAVSSTAGNSPIRAVSTGAGSTTTGPYITLLRDSAQTAGNNIGAFLFQSADTVGTAYYLYGQVAGRILSATTGSASGAFDFGTCVSAVGPATRLTIAAGVFTPLATGGDKGVDTINAVTLYENGTSLASKYGALASANIFTAAQTVRLDSAATSTVTVAATLSSTSTGTPAAGIGVALNFEAETAAGNNEIGAQISAVTTDVTSTSEDFDLVFSAMAAGAAVTERGRITSKGTYKHQSFTVAGLPAGTAGETCFASNGRKNGEGAAAGTGVLVFHDGTAWRACDTGATVAA
jgi:hypothetical protein